MSDFASLEPLSSRDDVPWVEKYRPSKLEDVVTHEDILLTLRKLMDGGNMPHIIFYGPPGTGKTTTIHACAHHLYGKEQLRANVLEMNASDDRGIDIIRNQVKEFSSTTSIFSLKPSSSIPAYKLVVLDEADQMSHDAQAALRRVIEKYSKNVRFCIICNHINKILPALQSRCTRFRFSPIKKDPTIKRITHVVEQEKVHFTPQGLAAAYRLSQGDLRRCLNTIQASVLALNEVTEDSIYRVTGNPTPSEVKAIVQNMITDDFSSSWNKIYQSVSETGISVSDLVREIYPIVMSMNLPLECKCFLVVKLADLEYYAAAGARETIGLMGILGAFQIVKESVTQNKPIANFIKK